MDWISSAISGVSSLFGNLFAGHQQLKATREYNKAQRELAEYQNEYNTEMWYKQNEYNSPVEQMQRYQDAGLNPNLIYSQGSPGNASEPASAAVPDVAMEDHSFKGRAISEAVNNAITTYAQSVQNRKIEREIAFMDSQEDAVKAQTERTLIESIGLEQDNLMKIVRAKWLPHEKRLEYMNQWQELQNKKVQFMIDQLDYQFNSETFSYRVRSTWLSNRESQARIDNLISSTDLNEQQKEVLKGELDVQKAKITNLLASASYSNAQAENAWNEYSAFSIRLANEISSQINTLTAQDIKNKIDAFAHSWNITFGKGDPSKISGILMNYAWQYIKKTNPELVDKFELEHLKD